MAYMAALESDLRALSAEARRRYPAVKDAAEHAILKLRSMSGSSEIAHNEDLVRIFLMACDTRSVKLSVIGLSCLQKLISHDAVATSALKDILSTLKDHAEMADDSVQLKTLQAILLIFQSRLHPDNEEDMARALSICLHLLENNRSSDSVHNTAAATFRQAVALIFDNVVRAESLPSEKSDGLRANTATNNVNSRVSQSGLLEARNVSVRPTKKESLSKAGKLGLLLLEDLTALAAGNMAADAFTSKDICIRYTRLKNYMKAPIYVYYELDNYYQNHRRYIKSRSDKQLLHGLQQKDVSSCKPMESSNGLPIVPCGLISWSLFNDTFAFDVKGGKLNVNRANISWKSDRDHKFGKNVFPFNFQNDSLIGGGKLDPSIPLSEQEDLIVWMRVSALPKFRKLYGVIEEDLDAGELLTVHLANNYNTYSSGGKKKLVLTTLNWLGSKNNFLGLSYIATGGCSILLAILFALIHVKFPRPHYDTSYLQSNKRGSAR